MSQQTSPNVANLSFQQNSTITIPIFSNDDDEDVAEWMKYFETSTIAMGWTDEQRFIALPGYFSWYSQKVVQFHRQIRLHTQTKNLRRIKSPNGKRPMCSRLSSVPIQTAT